MADEDCLCSSCCKLDFQKLFFACGTLTEANNTRSLAAIRAATNCPFCRLTLRILNSNPKVKRLENASCTMRMYEFGTLIRSRLTANISPTIQPWTLSKVESSWRRLSSDRFYHSNLIKELKESLAATDIKPSAEIPLVPTISRLWFTLYPDIGKEREHEFESEPDETLILDGIQVYAVDSMRDNPQNALLRGRPVNPTADVHLLRGWLEICKYSHGGTCSPRGMPGTRSFCFRLIDISRRCVVQAPLYCCYYALSYVWGRVEQPLLTDLTMDRFTADGGLSDDQPDITRTIKDAMYLCELLGQRYLWVDTLCIKQDSSEDKGQQIQNMGLVYSCAELTIVSAAGSDSNGGLPGLCTGPRATCTYIETLSGLQLTSAHQPFAPCISNTTWQSRGWTFQEKALSQRLLVFTKGQIFYHCNVATWSEDTILKNPDPAIDPKLNQDTDIDQFAKPGADLGAFKTYKNFVRDYASRNLTNSSDVSDAFRGIEELLSSQFDFKGFLYGLPAAYFNQALLWSSEGHFPGRRLKEFPSWSWMGWKEGGCMSIHFDQLAPRSRRSRDDLIWHRPCEGDGFAFIMVDEVLNSDNHTLTDLLSYFWYGGVQKQPFHHSPSTMPPLSQLICAYCRVWSLEVGFEGVGSSGYGGNQGDVYESGEKGNYVGADEEGNDDDEEGGSYGGVESNCAEGCERYTIRFDARSSPLGMIDLNAEWRKAQPARLDFVEIEREEKRLVYAMLVEWQDGIAYRVQRPLKPLRLQDVSYKVTRDQLREFLVVFG